MSVHFLHIRIQVEQQRCQLKGNTSLNFKSLDAMIVVSSKPEVIRLPKCLYNSPKQCAAPAESYLENW